MVVGLKQVLFNLLQLDFLQCPKPCCGILNNLFQKKINLFQSFCGMTKNYDMLESKFFGFSICTCSITC